MCTLLLSKSIDGLHLVWPRQVRRGAGLTPHPHDEAHAAGAPGVYGRRRHLDRRHDAVHVLALRDQRLQQLRWVSDVLQRGLLSHQHEHHHRLFLRLLASLHALRRPNELQDEGVGAAATGSGRLVSLCYCRGISPLIQQLLMGNC